MSESTIIISCIAIIVLGGVYLTWKIGEYLYELWVEKFTVDPDPANPDAPQKSEWERAWDSVEPHLATITNMVGMAIGTIIKISEDYRKQSYKTPDKPTYTPRPIQHNRRRPDPNAYRHGYLKDPVDGVWKPTHVVNGRRQAGEEVDSYFRGRGKKHWKVTDLQNEIDKKIKDIDDRISRLGTTTIPKGTIWDTRRKSKDYWDTED